MKKFHIRKKAIAVILGIYLALPGTVPAAQPRYIFKNQQQVINFRKQVARVAVSDPELLGFESISTNEILVQGKNIGQANLIVWFTDGSTGDINFLITASSHRIEDQLQKAIWDMQDGMGQGVKVRRIMRSAVPDDSKDLFVLEGKVPHQVSLVRILSMASLIMTGSADSEKVEIRVVADESGALLGRRQAEGQDPAMNSANSSRATTTLGNLVSKNLGRAKVIQIPEARLLSFIEVENLPRVRVSIRLYSVDRSKLHAFGTNLTWINSNFDQSRLRPIQLPDNIGEQPLPSSSRLTAGSLPDIQNVVSLLSGQFTNQFQIAASRYAVDAVFQALVTEGVARTLAEPTLTVLSGETSIFQVGGQVPIPVSQGTNVTVFRGIEFRDFGVELSVRPLVGEDDTITVDLAPKITSPISNTISSVNDAPVFESKSLKTTARLFDGQAMLVGGLIDRSASLDERRIPFISRIPLIGWLFKQQNGSKTDKELVVLVTPTIMRDPVADAALWEYPEIKLMEKM